MGEMNVEHVLLFLVGAFLVYHMMGKCGRVEGATDMNDCKYGKYPIHPAGKKCDSLSEPNYVKCGKFYEVESGWFNNTYYPCEFDDINHMCVRNGDSC